jgi:hypothetical protein
LNCDGAFLRASEELLGSADQWRWTDDDGVQRLLNGDELRAAISDGRLKPATLVWRRGMTSWKPAGELSELTIEDPATAETVTQENPTARQRIKPGVRRPPTPSIPAPGLSPQAAGGVQPSNMVNIAALHAQQGGKRPLTMMGVGDGRAKPPDANPVSIPAAPRMPRLGYRGGDKDTAEAVVGAMPPDGGWKDGAARRDDDDEETVTRVRTEEEAATLTEQSQPAKEQPKPRAKRSVPPPRKRSVPPPRRATKRPMPGRSRRAVGRGPQPKTLVSPGDEPNKLRSQIPEPVASDEVLSAAFPSKIGASKPGRGSSPQIDQSHTLASGDLPKRMPTAEFGASPFKRSASLQPNETLDASTKPDARAQKQKPVLHTAPMPALRPDKRSRPDPEFASEPWELKPKAPEPPPATENLAAGSSAGPSAGPPAGPAPVVADAVSPAPPQRTIPTMVPPRPSPALDPRIMAAAGGGGLLLILLAFFVGRWTAPAQTGMAAAAQARSGYTTVPLFARTRTTSAVKLRPCLMMRAPSRFAPAASHRIPIEMLPTPAGRLAVGYALSKQQARGMLIDPITGRSEELYKPEEIDDELSRVVPIRFGEDLDFRSTLSEQDGVRNSMFAAAEPPYVLGFDGKNFVKQPEPGGEKAALWPLDPPGKYADALATESIGDRGAAVTYRYNGKIYFGLLDKSGAAKSPAVNVEGSGGKVGKPNLGTNGVDLSVVYADKPPEGTAPIEIRWARGPIGDELKDATPLELPSGGPGGDAIAPAIAGLSGGRWLLMWTEGKPGRRVLRAQTYDRKYRPIGEALRVSPATGSFGQGAVGVVGESAIVVFFLATRRTYQIWGTVLQCH